MKPYKLNYFKFFNISEGDWMECNIGLKGCTGTAQDLHHIEPRGMGGSIDKDGVENLIQCCRFCHDIAEGDPDLKPLLKKIQAAIIRNHGT